jgi:predicted ATPase/DNA-binding SARP family transcriptional activator
LEYRVLGPLEVLGEDGSLPLGGAKQRALLALLLLNANRVVARERLVDELWPDDPPETAVATVQVYVSRLRKLLPEGTVLTRAPGYLLAVEPESIDLRQFEMLLAEARGAEPERASKLLREALALWRGRALAEFVEPFAQVECSRAEELRLTALEERTDADLALGRHADLIGELEVLIAEHPHRERLRGLLMLALYRSGRQAEALAVYRAAHAALEQLGIEPSEALRGLEKQILTQDTGLAPERRQTNLPGEPTPLIGRRRELAEVLGLMRTNKLVTLTGAGGSGKTRLALRAARELLDEFADGVWLISLASLSDPELVKPTIAQVLGARGELDDFLRGKQLLLLLDNLEQLLPDVASTVAGLEAKVLATSRERLNLAGEYEYLVPTLLLEEAVALFTQRARQRMPRFEPDEHVTELARRLDGLPLALELAAARVKVLSPQQIVERLGESLDLLADSVRDRPQRQRTLRATLEWSYDLLSGHERRLFTRLGIFAGSFDLDVAEAVAGAKLDALQLLVDKSLLEPTNSGRFMMLETVRLFARAQIDTAELESLRRCQLEHIERIARRMPVWPNGVAVSAEEQLFWLDQIEAVLPDVREVLPWALARHPARAARLITEIAPALDVRGGPHEARLWLERILDHRGELGPGQILARVCLRLGTEEWHEGNLDTAAELLGESIAAFRRLGDRLSAAWATCVYAHTVWAHGAYGDALVLYEQALTDFGDLGDDALVAETEHFIGNTLLQLGEVDRAREMLQQAIEAAGSNREHLMFMQHSLADLELEQRNLDAAAALYVRAHETAREFKDRFITAACLGGLACIAALRGETEVAGERWGRVKRIENDTDQLIRGEDRKRYGRILEPLTNDAAFRRGYEAGRVAEASIAAANE